MNALEASVDGAIHPIRILTEIIEEIFYAGAHVIYNLLPVPEDLLPENNTTMTSSAKVILAHGFLANGGGFRGVDYPPDSVVHEYDTMRSMELSAPEFEKVIQKYPRAIVIGRSQADRLIDIVLQRNKCPGLVGVITIEGPHNGTPMARLLPFIPSCREMAKATKQIPLNGIPIYNLYFRGWDELVFSKGRILDCPGGVINWPFEGSGHAKAVYSPEIWEAVNKIVASIRKKYSN
ncbi:hypothetical protein ACFL0X_01710 [Nanoarchaeota archaeon]